MPSPQPISLAVLISGGGTTLRNLIEKIEAGDLAAEIKLVISSNLEARGIEFAKEAGIRSLVVEKSGVTDAEQYREAIFVPCREAGVELVCMAGFLKHVLIPEDFENRVMNIHPALIPAFCGRGYYGQRVHRAVLDYGAKMSGCTVHFVDNQYDHGPIIAQRTVPVVDGDTPQALAERVFEQECQAYPEAINLFAAGKLQVDGRCVSISD